MSRYSKCIIAVSLFAALFVHGSAYAEDVATEEAASEEKVVKADQGLEKSRTINDFLSQARKAKRGGGAAVSTSDAERVCFNASSTLEECKAEVAKARAKLEAKSQKENDSSKDQTRTVVEEKQMSNREVQRLANSPSNRPRPSKKTAPAQPTPPY